MRSIGAIHLDLKLFLGNWTFGIHLDFWTKGLDVALGLGPLCPRLMWVVGDWMFHWQFQPLPWSYRESAFYKRQERGGGLEDA